MKDAYIDLDGWQEIIIQLRYLGIVLISTESRAQSLVVEDVDRQRCSGRGIRSVLGLDHVVQPLNFGVVERT